MSSQRGGGLEEKLFPKMPIFLLALRRASELTAELPVQLLRGSDFYDSPLKITTAICSLC